MDGLTITLDEPNSGHGTINPARLADARAVESHKVRGFCLE